MTMKYLMYCPRNPCGTLAGLYFASDKESHNPNALIGMDINTAHELLIQQWGFHMSCKQCEFKVVEKL